MAKSNKTTGGKEISMDLKNKPGPPVFNGGSPRSKPTAPKGKTVAKPTAPQPMAPPTPTPAPGPRDTAEVKSDRQAEAQKLVEQLRNQKPPVVQETGDPTMDSKALATPPAKTKPLTVNPTPPSADGEWVIMANYMSFQYGATRYTFMKGRPTLVPREVYKLLQKDGFV